MKKYEYKINNIRTLTLIHDDNYIEIHESFDCILYGDYKLIYSDDYCFSGYIESSEFNQITFLFDITHPLYNPLLHFLNKDNEIKISSDFKEEIYDSLCYVKIFKENDHIRLNFVNNIPYERTLFEKFDFQIKDIMFDLRRKLDFNRTNIKDRLFIFFKEAIEILEKESNEIKSEEFINEKEKKLIK